MGNYLIQRNSSSVLNHVVLVQVLPENKQNWSPPALEGARSQIVYWSQSFFLHCDFQRLQLKSISINTALIAADKSWMLVWCKVTTFCTGDLYLTGTIKVMFLLMYLNIAPIICIIIKSLISLVRTKPYNLSSLYTK